MYHEGPLRIFKTEGLSADEAEVEARFAELVQTRDRVDLGDRLVAADGFDAGEMHREAAVVAGSHPSLELGLESTGLVFARARRIVEPSMSPGFLTTSHPPPTLPIGPSVASVLEQFCLEAGIPSSPVRENASLPPWTEDEAEAFERTINEAFEHVEEGSPPS
jgi:hypothetical protein